MVAHLFWCDLFSVGVAFVCWSLDVEKGRFSHSYAIFFLGEG